MAKKKLPHWQARGYWRERGGKRRAYGDFRDLGGGREALKLGDSKTATTDPEVADALIEARVKELEKKQRRRAKGLPETLDQPLGTYAQYHLEEKEKEGVSSRWLTQVQRHLEEAVAFFGKDVALDAVTTSRMKKYINHLAALDNGRGGTISNGTQRKYLNSLSDLFARAVSDKKATSNPVASLYRKAKPTPEKKPARYFEPWQVALLLESARTYRPPKDKGAFNWMYPLLATFAYTGGRKSEVLGLEVDDVSFRLGRIFFRENEWRGLKTSGSDRDVPIWPDLEEILREYIMDRERAGGLGTLLFPSLPRKKKKEEGQSERGRLAKEKMVRDVRKALDHIAERAGWKAGDVRLHALRHSYIANRIQTLDRGAPVSLYTVAREVGHKSTNMIEDRYGHVIRARNPRADVVEYRVQNHPKDAESEVRERLEALERAVEAAAKEEAEATA